MNYRKFTPLMTFHLVLMAMALFISCISVSVFLSIIALIDYSTIKGVYGFTAINLLQIAALGFGIAYLLKGYSKDGATYYKGFMVMTLCASVVMASMSALYSGKAVVVFLMIVKVLALLALAVWKDLGKRNSWMLFFIVLAVDIACTLLVNSSRNIALFRAVAVASRLLMDGTIGLAIKGKYDDKDARETR